MTTPDPSREAFLRWFAESGMTKFQETAWAAWQAAMAHCVSSIPADAITVNLVRHVGLDKHVARECEQVVRQLLLPAAPKQEGST